jgi:hypothetical protein
MLPMLIAAATPIIGAAISSRGNQRAADTAADAQLAGTQAQIAASREARQEFREAADRGIAAIRAGTGRYAETIAPLLTPNPVGLPVRRGLTPGQEIARSDLQREGRATLAASGLRGAGRAGVGTILDADRRFVAAAADANDRDTRGEVRRAQGAADDARSGLARIYAQEGSAIANTETGTGARVGESLASDGRAASAAAANSGIMQGQAITANSQLWGDAIGALGSVIASASRPGANSPNRWTATGSPV